MSSSSDLPVVSDVSQRQAAAIAAYSYLVVFILGIFSNFFAFEQLIVAGDGVATSNNIMAHETLFRFGIAGWLIVIVCDAVVAWALYIVLKPVNKSLALMAAWFRLVFVAIFASSFVHHLSILQLLSHADYLNPDYALEYLKGKLTELDWFHRPLNHSLLFIFKASLRINRSPTFSK